MTLDDSEQYVPYAACSGGRIVSWIIYCWMVWCERKTLFPAGNLRSFTSKRTGADDGHLVSADSVKVGEGLAPSVGFIQNFSSAESSYISSLF